MGGNIDDPSFSLGKMIWHAIGNVFEKVATAPFAALGKLFGGGSEQPLDVVEFSPGTADLVPAGAKAVETLAKALDARPGLRLEIEGTADDASDGRALRLRELRKRARQAKWLAGTRAREASPDQVELTDAEYRSWVETSFRRTLGANASTPAKPVDGRAAPEKPAFQEMEAGLLEAIVVPPEDYRSLAQQRSEEVRQRLAAARPPIDTERLFLTQGGERARKEGGARAYFTLK